MYISLLYKTICLKEKVNCTGHFSSVGSLFYQTTGNTFRSGKLSTVDFLVKVACSVKDKQYFQFKKHLT
jgi:hypothetical protein